MNPQSEQYVRMIEEHLSTLTNVGRDYAAEIVAATVLLEKDLQGESKLSKQERMKIFEILKASANEFKELLDWSIEERRADSND